MILKYIIINSTKEIYETLRLSVALDYSRFEAIPTGVTRTKLIRVKQLILFIIPQSIWPFECT